MSPVRGVWPRRQAPLWLTLRGLLFCRNSSGCCLSSGSAVSFTTSRVFPLLLARMGDVEREIRASSGGICTASVSVSASLMGRNEAHCVSHSSRLLCKAMQLMPGLHKTAAVISGSCLWLLAIPSSMPLLSNSFISAMLNVSTQKDSEGWGDSPVRPLLKDLRSVPRIHFKKVW